MENKRLLLVGCGQVGSRHLQAVSSLREVAAIDIVEPNEKAVEIAKQRLKEVVDINLKIKLRWFKSLEDVSESGDICIVATTAKDRCQTVKKTAQILGYKNFLLEKIVSQSKKEYIDLLDFSQNKMLSVWVNLQTRTYDLHKYIKSRLAADEPIIFNDSGGNWGLACNGIHYADLFLFYDGSKSIKSCGSRIDSVLHPSRRGSDLFDLSGTIHGMSDRGSDFTISYSGLHQSCDTVYVISKDCRFFVDHVQKIALESRADSGWTWNKIDFNQNIMVSHLSKQLVSGILNNNSCALPTLVEGFPAHEYIFDELLPHFNRLMGVNNKYCPVT